MGKLIRLLMAFLLLSIACFILPSGMSRIGAISLTVASDSHDLSKFFLDNSLRQPLFSENESSPLKEMPGEEGGELFYRFPNMPATTWLRFDPGEHPGITRIYGMVVHQALGRQVRFNAAEIYKGFRPGGDGITMSLKDDYVEIVSVVEDPFIVSVPGFITAPRPIFFYFPVILLTFFFYIFLSKVEIETIRTIFLPQRKLRPDMTVIAPLDGLRGIAALLVVADHTWPWFLGAGASGVHIFFVLSGFLLCRPFVSNPGMVSSVESWVRYGARRLRRILPMYYLYLFLTFGMSLRLYELYLHVFFIEAKGHLWAIPQEMVFYTVFPVIALLNYFVLRSKIFLIIPSLLLMVFLWGKFVTIKYVYLFGMMNSRLPFRLDVFLIGVVFSYLYFAVWVNTANIKMSTVLKNSLTVVGVALLALFVFFSNGHLFHNNLIYSQIYSLYFAIGAGMLVFFLSCSGENLLTKWLSSSLLSSLGIVSYSLYLFHPLIIAFVKQVGGKTLNSLFGVRFVLVLSISYFVACLLYHFIERPLLGCVVKKKIPGVANQCS